MNTVPEQAGEAAQRLIQFIRDEIPLARAMDLQLRHHDADMLSLWAPLAPNVNDKGCAFGGSLVSLLTLAGWGLIELGLRAEGLECDIYVGDSQVRYQQPVWGELRGVARFAEGGAMAPLAASLRARGKGRVDVVCEIAGEAGTAATLTARFFAKLRKPA